MTGSDFDSGFDPVGPGHFRHYWTVIAGFCSAAKVGCVASFRCCLTSLGLLVEEPSSEGRVLVESKPAAVDIASVTAATMHVAVVAVAPVESVDPSSVVAAPEAAFVVPAIALVASVIA